jgi:hypothetical protein
MTTKIATPFYFHGDKESNCEEFDDFFPGSTNDARGNAAGVGYEIEFTGEWHDNGEYWATSLKTEHGKFTFPTPIRL